MHAGFYRVAQGLGFKVAAGAGEEETAAYVIYLQRGHDGQTVSWPSFTSRRFPRVAQWLDETNPAKRWRCCPPPGAAE
jgi:hypothetical protein